jgi:hypothetical protein
MDAALERGNQDGLPEGSPWQIVVPTPLVCLDSDTVKLPNWDIVPAGKPPLFKPSEALCNGMPYNLAQWPDARSVATAMKALGFGVADMQDYDSYFRSGEGRRFVQAFQRRANELGVATVLGGRLRVDGIIGPCTLRGLTVMMDKLARGQWPGAGTT